MTTQLDKALALVALGLPVFPCRERDEWVGENLYESKSPYTRKGFHDATTDPAKVEKFWTTHPEALVGVATGQAGIVVLDIDIDLERGIDGLHELTENDVEIPDTLNYVTRRGGQHHIYRGPKDLKPAKDYVTEDGVLLEGVDRRSGGSYIIWWGDVPADLDSVTEVPEWFTRDTAMVVGEGFEGTVSDWLTTIAQDSPDGLVRSAIENIPTEDFGHDTMIRQQTYMVKLASEGHPGVEEALERLRDEWLRGKYDTYENRRDFQTGLAGAVAKFGGVTEAEKDFWTRRPILKHIHESSRALMACPWALLGGGLLRAIHSIPYQVHYKSCFGPASLNMINVFVGDSGGGKSLLQSQLDMVFDFQRTFIAHEVGSGEAISEQYVREVSKDTGEPEEWSNMFHAEMFSFDEVGRLNAMQGRSGGTTVLEYLKTGWSGGRLGRRLVGGRGVEIPAHSYRMTAFLNAQPERADMLLSEDEVEGGFPGRVFWVNLQDPSVINEYQPREVTPRKVSLPRWSKTGVVEALPQMNDAHIQDRMNFHSGTRDKLDGHELMLKVRLATGLMALDGRSALNDEDWELAETVLNHSRTTRKMVQQRIADKNAKDTEARGRAAGQREAIAKEAASDTEYSRALKQAETAVEKLRTENKNPTKGVVKSKLTRSLQIHIDEIWAEMGFDQ